MNKKIKKHLVYNGKRVNISCLGDICVLCADRKLQNKNRQKKFRDKQKEKKNENGK